VTAIDLHEPVMEAAESRWGKDERVTLMTGDYLESDGPFDFIWCAGAVYFVGIETALAAWAAKLAKGGAIAFSEPCLFTDTPTEEAVAFWDGYARLTDADGISAQGDAAGFETLATRKVSDIGWESYYRPFEDRVAKLLRTADERLMKMLESEGDEPERWRAVKEETGYLLSVVKPK